MHPEYDFDYFKAVRGKYYHRLIKEGSNVAVLEPDVAKVFPDSAAVNDALRSLLMDSKKIQEIRQRLRVTQEAFAHMVGVTFSTVSRWENGKSKPNRVAQRILVDLEKKASRSVPSRS